MLWVYGSLKVPAEHGMPQTYNWPVMALGFVVACVVGRWGTFALTLVPILVAVPIGIRGDLAVAFWVANWMILFGAPLMVTGTVLRKLCQRVIRSMRRG